MGIRRGLPERPLSSLVLEFTMAGKKDADEVTTLDPKSGLGVRADAVEKDGSYMPVMSMPTPVENVKKASVGEPSELPQAEAAGGGIHSVEGEEPSEKKAAKKSSK